MIARVLVAQVAQEARRSLARAALDEKPEKEAIRRDQPEQERTEC